VDSVKQEGGWRLQRSVRTVGQRKARVSVVTVVRNAERFIEQTIRSVLDQTYESIEYVIVDGGSTDGTLDIIRKYDDRIAYWISEPDRGIYDAMNKGIDRATGEWVIFMNAGDRFYSPDTVRQVMNAPIDDADLLYGHCQMVYGPGRALIWKTKAPAEIWKGMICRHQSVFASLSVCRKLHFDLNYKIGADFAFLFQSARNGFRLKPIDVIVSSVTAGGVSDENLIQGIKENWRAVARVDDSLKVDLHYRWRVLWTYVKAGVRKIIPSKIDHFARAIKHR
jgi:glycosyltransferase involved in cell wall biosynthesis